MPEAEARTAGRNPMANNIPLHLALIALAAFATQTDAAAQTVEDALELAFLSNPSLLKQRTDLRIAAEEVAQARAGGRLRAGLTAAARSAPSSTLHAPAPDASRPTGGIELEFSQPLWSGGRIRHSIAAAEAELLAERENVRAAEHRVFAAVVTAYADVIRDAEILDLREFAVEVVGRQVDETSARFEAGTATRTDVAQAEARLAGSQAELSEAAAQLARSQAAYAAVVGEPPEELAPIPAWRQTPDDLEEALAIASEHSPVIRAAELLYVAAEAEVRLAHAGRLPSSRVTGSIEIGDVEGRGGRPAGARSFEGSASVTLPLFTGGRNGSRVVEAREASAGARFEVEQARRDALRSVRSAHARAAAARAAGRAGEEAVQAARLAAEGVRREAELGLRTPLDVLNQELELRNSQIALAQARRDEHVSRAELLAAMGCLRPAGPTDAVAGDASP